MGKGGGEPNRLETVEEESGKWVQELPLKIRKFKWLQMVRKKKKRRESSLGDLPRLNYEKAALPE